MQPSFNCSVAPGVNNCQCKSCVITVSSQIHVHSLPKLLRLDKALFGQENFNRLIILINNYMASDRMRKKIKDSAEIFGHITCMQKHALIMRKLHRIMRKVKQVIKLIIRPVQCIYMLTVNP